MKRIIATLFVIAAAALSCAAQTNDFDRYVDDAKAGNATAQNGLGIAYAEGLGVRRDQKQAVYWFRKSAAQGDSSGTCNLGLHYGKGWGVRRNPVLMMKYIFAANALDSLNCNPADFIYTTKPKPTKRQIQKGSELAVAWLRRHPNFKNDFGKRPWLGEGQYPVTVREQGGSVQLPQKRSKKRR